MGRLLPAALLVAMLTGPARAEAPAHALPAWLTGTWAMERGAEWAEELWTAPRGSAMVGLSRSGFGPDEKDWQWLRIVRQGDGELALLVQNRGGAVAEFRQAFASAEAIEFASGRSEFPQRIRFSRAGQLLTIEQSRMDGSEAVAVNYRPVETAPKD